MPQPPWPGRWVEQLTVEQLSELTNQSMWTRDTIRWMLHQTAAHRWDGHDCPIYCVPLTLDHFLQQCTAEDLRLLMVTFVKDSVHIGPDPEFEGIDGES